MNKSELRQLAIARRRGIDDAARQSYSSAITEKLIQYISQRDVKALLSYRAMNSEVNADSIFDLPDYHPYAPVTHHHEHMEWRRIRPSSLWQPGLFGVDEPQDGELWQPNMAATLLICPLTGFDRRGNRLGMGKGCFDYWLANHRSALQAVIGLAFSCQEMTAIPAEAHDIPMDVVITENEVIPCLNQ